MGNTWQFFFRVKDLILDFLWLRCLKSTQRAHGVLVLMTTNSMYQIYWWKKRSSFFCFVRNNLNIVFNIKGAMFGQKERESDTVQWSEIQVTCPAFKYIFNYSLESEFLCIHDRVTFETI